MRKRSSYKPRPVLVNPLAYVIEGMKPVAHHESYLIDLKIKNHGAMTALTQGRATRADMDVLIAMNNITEALWRMGFGKEFNDVMRGGHQALIEIANRGAATSRFIVRASEMNALNDLMDLHDAQMDVITIKDMEAALALAKSEVKAGRATRLIAKGLSQ
jgi:hypothetical protein